MKNLPIALVLVCATALSPLFGAANDIVITQWNSGGTATVPRVFSTGNNSLIGTNGSGTPSLTLVGTSLSLTGGTLDTAQDLRTSASPTFAGLTNSGLTNGRVTFASTGGLLSDDADMTFATDTLTVTNIAVPTLIKQAVGATGYQSYNTADQATNFERLEILYETNTAFVRSTQGGSGTVRPLVLRSTQSGGNNASSVTLNGTAGSGVEFRKSTAQSSAMNFFVFNNTSSTTTSGTTNFLSIAPTYNQASGTAANTDLLINRTQTAVGSGAQLLIDLQVGSVTKFNVSNTGVITTTLADGSLTAASGVITSSSDGRLKIVDGAFGRGLAEVQRLRPVLYRWRPDSGIRSNQRYAGFVAQDVQGVIPEAVSANDSGVLSLSDRPILGALVNATQELAARPSTAEIRVLELVAALALVLAIRANLKLKR